MKKFFRTLAGILCFASVILAGCETPDGGIDLKWTLGWMAVAVITGLCLRKCDTQFNNQ